MKTWLRHTLIGLGVAGFILAALTVLIFNKSTLGWQANSIPTGSMRPAMPPGSLVLAHRVPLSSLKVGDVITHTNPLTMRTTMTHRIIKVYKIDGKIPAFITKGDANPSPDPAFVGGLVKGRVVFHVPYVGWLLMWAKTWAGITVLVYIPALLIMIHETRLLAEYLRLKKPYHLEGTLPHLRPNQSAKPTIRPKWAIAASSAFVIALAATGWQAAGALVTPATSTLLLDLKANTIEAKATPATTSPATMHTMRGCTTTSTTDVNTKNASTQSANSGNATTTGTAQGGTTQSGATGNVNTTNTTVKVDTSPSPACVPNGQVNK